MRYSQLRSINMTRRQGCYSWRVLSFSAWKAWGRYKKERIISTLFYDSDVSYLKWITFTFCLAHYTITTPVLHHENSQE